LELHQGLKGKPAPIFNIKNWFRSGAGCK
jgi:hypothetical protein